MPTPKAPTRIERLENRIGGLRAKAAKTQADLQAAYEKLRAIEREDSAKARLDARAVADEINALQQDNHETSTAISESEKLLATLKTQFAKLDSRVRELEAASGAFDAIRPSLQLVVDRWPTIFATLAPALQRATYDQAGGVRSLLQTVNDLRAQLTAAREELARWESQ